MPKTVTTEGYLHFLQSMYDITDLEDDVKKEWRAVWANRLPYFVNKLAYHQMLKMS